MTATESRTLPANYGEAHAVLDEVECSLKHHGRDGGKECNFIDLAHRAIAFSQNRNLSYEQGISELALQRLPLLCEGCVLRCWAVDGETQISSDGEREQK